MHSIDVFGITFLSTDCNDPPGPKSLDYYKQCSKYVNLGKILSFLEKKVTLPTGCSTSEFKNMFTRWAIRDKKTPGNCCTSNSKQVTSRLVLPMPTTLFIKLL